MQLQSSVTPFSARPVRAFTERSVHPLKQQCRRQSLQLSSRSLSQQRRSNISIGPRAEAVDTDNKFRFNHSVSKNNFEVKGDLKTVFNYAADFSHISSWDSGMQLSPELVQLCLAADLHSDCSPTPELVKVHSRPSCHDYAGTTGSQLRESNSRAAFKEGDTVALMTVLWGVKSSTL